MSSARVYLTPDRAPRHLVDAPGLVRRDGYPESVMIDNLSTSGVHFSADFNVAIDEIVALGIPGIGIQLARVVRQSATGYGCAFLQAISEAEVASAASAAVVKKELRLADGALSRPVSTRLSKGDQALLLFGLIAIAIIALATLAQLFLATA